MSTAIGTVRPTTERASVVARFPAVSIAGTASASLIDLLAHRGYPVAADGADVVLIAGNQPLPSTGAGLVVLAGPDTHESVLDLLASAGITLTAAESSTRYLVLPDPEATPSIDFLAGTSDPRIAQTGVLAISGNATTELAAAEENRRPAGIVGAATVLDGRRIFVLAGAPTGLDLVLFNALTWAARDTWSHTPSDTRSDTATHPAWQRLKAAAVDLQPLQAKDGSVAAENADRATELIGVITGSIRELTPLFPHDHDYLSALVVDFDRWVRAGLGEPDFLDSLLAFQPQRDRIDGLEHLVVFPMYTQNGSADRLVEAVLIKVVWPEFIADLQGGDYSNKLFVPISFLDFTPGYNTNSAVLFPETVAMREVPTFTWGAIFADREAARFSRVVRAAADTTRLALPPDAARLLDDQALATETFVMWDLIHDRTHMHGDLPFDPFMIKQRMPFFLYSLEELRCDLTAFRESVKLEEAGVAHAKLVQYAIIFDRIFRFAITGNRVRNYDGLGGQLLFAWLHQRHVLHWTDNRLHIDWDKVTDAVLELGREIDDLYWRSIDRPKAAHWLAAYALVSGTVTPHPASVWAQGAAALPLDGPPKGLTDAVLPDEFPLSMFYEALSKKLGDVIASTAGITG